MIKSKIFVTGGSGKAGKHLIPYLLERGYSVVNADLVPLLIDGVDNINLDITDSGQLFNALSGYANIPELKSGEGLKSFEAVVHLAAIPRILVKPGLRRRHLFGRSRLLKKLQIHLAKTHLARHCAFSNTARLETAKK